MNFIVTVDKNWAIGCKKNTFVTIPEVEQLLRAETKGKVILMSRYVAEKFPGGLTDVDRINYVITHDMSYTRKGVNVVHSKEEFMEAVSKYSPESIYCIGGESVFNTFFDEAVSVDVTYINYEYEADAFFTDLDKSDDFQLIEESEEKTYFDLEYVYRRYERKK